MRGRLIIDAVLGLVGGGLAVALLVASERVFAVGDRDSTLVGALLLLAAAGQAAPSLGLVLAVHRLVLRKTQVLRPHADLPKSPRGQNIILVATFAFGLSFLGVFALLHSTVFVPLVALGLVGWFLYVPLAREVPRARIVWRILSASAVTFGLVAAGLVTLSRL